MPARCERREHVGVQVRGWVHQRGGGGPFRGSADEPAVGAPVVEQGAPRLDRALYRHWLR